MKSVVVILALAAAAASGLQLTALRPALCAPRLRPLAMVDAEAEAPKVKVKVRVRSKKERTAAAADYAPPAAAEDDATAVTINVKEADKASFAPVEQPKGPTVMGSEGEKLTDDEEALLAAVQKANSSRVLTALQTGVNPNIRDPKGRTPLHFVAGVGLAPAAMLLLHFGAEPNVRDEEMLTPLHMASGYTNPQTVKVLLAGGADPTLEGSQGKPMDVAIALGNFQLTQFMERTGVEKVTKKKDEKLEQLKEIVGALEDPEKTVAEFDWDEELVEVLKTIAQEDEAGSMEDTVPKM